MRRFLITLIAVITMGMSAGAYIDNGDGSVTLEYGDSYGNVAAAYDMNYYNLGYYNGQDPDSAVVQPGQTIYLGESSYGSYWGGSGYTDYGYSDQTYASGGGYDSYTPSYDYGYDYSYPSYSEESVYGSSYIVTGYDYNSGYNANLACQLNNGIELAPGETYYIDNYLGDGGYDMGFIDSTCLDGQGGTFQAPGGGICAVSTAIHSAAKKDIRMTILRRVPHNNGDGTTGVSYASAEDQAAFSAGGANLVIRNDSNETVKLSTSYDGYGVSATWSSSHK